MKLLGLVLILASARAYADAPLTLIATPHGSALDLTFTNTGTSTVTFTSHVKAGLDHYDYLTVTLDGKSGKRTLHFWESRNKSIPIDVQLAPGKALTKTVDLALWAFHGDNAGGPLAPGAYRAEVVWDMSKAPSGSKQKLVATAKLAIPEATEKPCKEDPAVATAKLELFGLQAVKPGPNVMIGLHNNDQVAHCVHGIIRTHETQNDWLVLTVTDPKGATTRIGLSGDRDKSYPVSYELPPGATLWNTWNLVDWHKRIRGAKPLPVKSLASIAASWDAKGEREVWRGSAATEFVVLMP